MKILELLKGQVTRKVSLAVIATGLAAYGATLLMNSETWLEVGKAAVALGFSGVIFGIREWSKKWDSTVVVRDEKPPDYHYTTNYGIQAPKPPMSEGD